MKKIFLSTIILTGFSFSIILFEMSCKKSADAQTSTTSGLQQLNLILFTRYINTGNTSTSSMELWTCNYDGSNQKKVPITLPTNYYINNGKLSPDGKKLFFTAGLLNNKSNMYSCNIDGSGLTTLIDESNNKTTSQIDNIQGAY